MLALVCAAVTLAVLAAVFFPLLRRARPTAERAQYDRAVYRDQLQELERDAARGLIGEQELDQARLEIQRRMLRETLATDGPRLAGSPRLALALALLVAAVSTGIYLRLGAPGVADEPYATRVLESAAASPKNHVDMASAAAALEARLRDNPADSQGWLLYARTLASLGQWQKSVDAYGHIAELIAADADIAESYGEVLILAAGGTVTARAHEVLAAAVAKDPKRAVARYYLALGQAQAGEPKLALEAWRVLAGEAPEGSALREEIVRQIGHAAEIAGVKVPDLPKGTAPEAPASGPDDDAIAAAANMSPEQRETMIRAMVSQLAGKLASDPGNTDEWVRLGRAYLVLGDTDRASEAFDHAAKLNPSDLSIPLQEIEATFENRKPDAPIPARTVAVLRRINAADPKQPEALWYLGIAAAQDGHLDDAEQYWKRLLPLLPADGEDAKMVRSALEAMTKK